VVYVEDASAKQPGVATAATIKIHDKEFAPYITVVTAGANVDFGNGDALTHHIFSPDGEKWDTGNLPQQGTVERKFDSPGAYTLLCNLHPEMLGYLLVIPSSYFAAVGTDGKYTLGGLPPGSYRVTAWVPRMQTSTQSVTVAASGDVTADFSLQRLPGAGSSGAP
jgi:plastocyanin